MATTLSTRRREEVVDVKRLSARSTKLHVCAECTYALLFAVQPRAVCTCRGSASAGRVLFAGQPARADMSPRDGRELVLAMSACGVKKARAVRERFVADPVGRRPVAARGSVRLGAAPSDGPPPRRS